MRLTAEGFKRLRPPLRQFDETLKAKLERRVGFR